MPSNDDVVLTEDVMMNKIVFSSIHQSKGLERKCTLIIGFDTSYYAYFNKSADPRTCCNELYVAITRATERLYLFHSVSPVPSLNNNYLKFINPKRLSQFAKIITTNAGSKIKPGTDVISTIPLLNVMQLIRQLPDSLTEYCMRKMRPFEIAPAKFYIKTVSKIEEKFAGKQIFENVADINGNVSTSYNELMRTGDMTIRQYLNSKTDEYKKIFDIPTSRFVPAANHTPEHPVYEGVTEEYLLKLAVLYDSIYNNIIYRANQIKHFNWMTFDTMDLLHTSINAVLGENARYEQDVNCSIGMYAEISGRIDAIDDEYVWEFKTTDVLETQHFIQLAVYAYMYRKNGGEKRKYRLYNIKTGEMHQLDASMDDLNDIMVALVCNLHYEGKKFNDKEFIDRTEEINTMLDNNIGIIDTNTDDSEEGFIDDPDESEIVESPKANIHAEIFENITNYELNMEYEANYMDDTFRAMLSTARIYQSDDEFSDISDEEFDNDDLSDASDEKNEDTDEDSVEESTEDTAGDSDNDTEESDNDDSE